MRILHTSDWHLGKRLMDRERLPEQIEVLDEIATICDEERVDIVLVAGDVFDTYLPPAEAEDAFFRAMKKLAGESRAVVLISGNHDDGLRLAASAPIAGEEGIYLFGGGETVPLGGNRPIRAVAAGENFVTLESAAGEKVYINALPYPNEARLKEDKTEESYAEKTLRWICAGDESYDGTMPHILLSHLFAAGGSVSESERDIALGGARAVPVGNFPAFGYTALGHLHRRQKVRENVYYSGSLLQYSFDEANTEKFVLLLETEGSEVRLLREIPLRSGKRLVRLEANGVEDALVLLEQYPENYVELTLHLAAPLTTRETQALREANSGLVSLITRVNTGESSPVVSRAKLGAGELFEEYYRSVFGREASKELTERFLLLLEEDA